ncbi:MAG: hypothetical protein HKN05_08275 [Rhizobiales bacterium]|nr:hypothetical protein [Hyphomicrobiales bacterium]
MLDQLDDELVGFDRTVFPAARNRFLRCWLTAPGHIVRVARMKGAFAGHGVLRPCKSGYKIGPLFAVDTTVARHLVRTCYRLWMECHHQSKSIWMFQS